MHEKAESLLVTTINASELGLFDQSLNCMIHIPQDVCRCALFACAQRAARDPAGSHSPYRVLALDSNPLPFEALSGATLAARCDASPLDNAATIAASRLR